MKVAARVRPAYVDEDGLSQGTKCFLEALIWGCLFVSLVDWLAVGRTPSFLPDRSLSLCPTNTRDYLLTSCKDGQLKLVDLLQMRVVKTFVSDEVAGGPSGCHPSFRSVLALPGTQVPKQPQSSHKKHNNTLFLLDCFFVFCVKASSFRSHSALFILPFFFFLFFCFVVFFFCALCRCGMCPQP